MTHKGALGVILKIEHSVFSWEAKLHWSRVCHARDEDNAATVMFENKYRK